MLERASARLNLSPRFDGLSGPLKPYDPIQAAHEAKVAAAIAANAQADARGHEPPKAAIPIGTPSRSGRVNHGDLQLKGYLRYDAPVTGLAEEFRRVKRQLLGAAGGDDPRARIILVCSAQPDEGKTFCAVNLALSMAGEQDLDVLLVDADCAKPEVLSTLGLSGGAGLIDALADPSVPLEDCIIQTDIPNLQVLPAGRLSHGATELLTSRRAEELFARLIAGKPNRIVICDSAPALYVSTASVMAMHAGQVLLVVRADKTVETEIQEALEMLKTCSNIHLLLNGVTFSPFGRRVGKDYGYGEQPR
ncbi:AAA family ATPase [Aquisediminimonas sediminicola]|uniref:AAA family ATPase n=1 Tax=Alteraquisediminimonas sediminicola TaxID=2676787 RepID=UPI001FE3E588|nr:AAA family ATPase [Aquisediminimonas sediminicola]